MGPAQRAAWDAYLALTAGLLPALDQGEGDSGVNPRLGAVAIRIRRYAHIWGEHGPMLVAAVHSAIRLYRDADRPALISLLQVMAHRLFLLSAGQPSRHYPGQRNQKAP